MARRDARRLEAWMVSATIWIIVLASSTPAFAWLRSITKPGDTANEDPFSVVVDGTGGVIAAGRLNPLVDDADFSFFVVKFDGTTAVEMWRQELGETGGLSFDDVATRVSADATGDVVASGIVTSLGSGEDFLVIKFDGTTGAEIWRQQLDAGGNESGGTVVDSAGDVIASGTLDERVVIKFDGATGAELWRLGLGDDPVGARLADGAGNLILTGTVENPGTGSDCTVRKVDGATGGEIWRTDVDGTGTGPDGCGVGAGMDATGDVVVTGTLDDAVNGEEPTVIKFDGATGAEIWREALNGTDPGDFDGVGAVGIDASGDVFTAGGLSNVGSGQDFTVLKLDGASGAELWRRAIDGTASDDDHVSALEVDAAGDVVVGGYLDNLDTDRDFVVVKLDGSSGAELWRHERAGTRDDSFFSDNDEATSLDLNPTGDVFVGASFENEDTGDDFTVLRLDGDSGSLGALDGRSLLARDPGNPTRRSFKLVVKDDLIASPKPGSANDPTLAGATVRIVNPTTAEEATFVLPAGPDWQGLGNPPGETGYKYRASSGAGPCRSVVVKRSEILRVSCSAKSGSIPFTLDEVSQGTLAATLKLGDAPPQCAVFGGLVIRDQPGFFNAKSATAESGCP